MAATLFEDRPGADGTLSVGEVSRRVERALRREFGDRPIWVRGQIRDLRRAPTGHVHFTLAAAEEDGEGDGDRSLPVVLFSGDRDRVNRMLTANGPAVRMDDGIEVRIRAEVRFYAPKSQISLRLTGIDPTFTLGRLAERRDALLRRLAADGTLGAQRLLPFPPLARRIGLVTSLGSAAHADVHRTLAASGFAFTVVECDARVQGADAERAIVGALAAVTAAEVDVVLLVRGGGARTDLAVFDSEAVARAIARLPVPVLTGIGHETDTSVADEVAWQRFATPTASAAHLVAHTRASATALEHVLARCLRAAGVAVHRAGDRLAGDAGRLAGLSNRHLREADRRLAAATATLARRPLATLATAAGNLEQRRARLAALDPARLQALGWSITRTADGRLVRSPAEVRPGEVLHTTTAGGTIASRVEEHP